VFVGVRVVESISLCWVDSRIGRLEYLGNNPLVAAAERGHTTSSKVTNITQPEKVEHVENPCHRILYSLHRGVQCLELTVVLVSGKSKGRLLLDPLAAESWM
jgi:hypothetical protein